METLKKHDVKATFFVISGQVKTSHNLQLVNRALDDGHELQNHGQTDTMHALKSKDRLRKEIEDCDDILDQLYKEKKKVRPRKFYRPGHGVFNKKMFDLAREMDFSIVLGSTYPHDPQIPFYKLNLWYIKKHVENGDIIIVHDRGWTAKLLDELIPWLKDQGYEFLTLSEI